MGLDPDTRRWVESVSGARVDDYRRLLGGLSSEVYGCEVGEESVVVRHIVDQDWLRREPDLIDREAAALSLLENSDVPAPRLLAADGPSGRLLMSYLTGSVRAGADHLRAGVDTMADMAARIAAVSLPYPDRLSPWRSWVPADPEPPPWGEEPVWRAAIDRYIRGPRPEPHRPVLLHRDFHPLNLLWEDTTIVGTVDWVNACLGHPHAELGHCRWNLTVLADVETADHFLSRYLTVTDYGTYDHWWDLAAALGFISWPVAPDAWQAVGRMDITTGTIVKATDLFLSNALSHL